MVDDETLTSSSALTFDNMLSSSSARGSGTGSPRTCPPYVRESLQDIGELVDNAATHGATRPGRS